MISSIDAYTGFNHSAVIPPTSHMLNGWGADPDGGILIHGGT